MQNIARRNSCPRRAPRPCRSCGASRVTFLTHVALRHLVPPDQLGLWNWVDPLFHPGAVPRPRGQRPGGARQAAALRQFPAARAALGRLLYRLGFPGRACFGRALRGPFGAGGAGGAGDVHLPLRARPGHGADHLLRGRAQGAAHGQGGDPAQHGVRPAFAHARLISATGCGARSSATWWPRLSTA